MPKKRRTYKKSRHHGGAVDLTPPPIESFGSRCGGSTPSEDAILCNKQDAMEQSRLNNQHGGSPDNDDEIVIPQPHGECTTPNCAGKTSSAVTESFLNAKSNSEYDEAVHENKKQSGGKRKKRKTRRKRRGKKTRKTRKKRSGKKKSRRKSKK